MRVLRVFAVAVVVSLLGLLVWDVTKSDSGKVAKSVDAGKVVRAPKLVLPYHEREGKFDLASHRGKVVVVNFWASWCVGCKQEAKALNAAARQWRNKGVVFVGVDVNDFSSAASRFLDRHDVGYTIVRDGQGSSLGKWGVTGLPETFFVDRKGRVVPPHVLAAASGEQLDEGIRRALRS
jgi:cytochrome c biogenesis protein CcmG/thiol:disulfide interchange protein DsbE